MSRAMARTILFDLLRRYLRAGRSRRFRETGVARDGIRNAAGVLAGGEHFAFISDQRGNAISG